MAGRARRWCNHMQRQQPSVRQVICCTALSFFVYTSAEAYLCNFHSLCVTMLLAAEGFYIHVCLRVVLIAHTCSKGDARRLFFATDWNYTKCFDAKSYACRSVACDQLDSEKFCLFVC
jgi:hypothetical protein